jgi:hypothetical protein
MSSLPPWIRRYLFQYERFTPVCPPALDYKLASERPAPVNCGSHFERTDGTRRGERTARISAKMSEVQGKVVSVFNLIKHYAVKAYGGVDV